jgi:hypothetical protein
VYQSEAYFPTTSVSGTTLFEIPVSDGTYDVTLMFAELYWTASNQRRFSVEMEGTMVERDLDVFSASGGSFVAMNHTHSASVTDGSVTIRGFKQLENPQICGIVVSSCTS